MAQIWKEEHEVAAKKLDGLQIQQRMQAIADLESCKIKKNEDYILPHMKPIVPKFLIVKSNFQHKHALTERNANTKAEFKEEEEKEKEVGEGEGEERPLITRNPTRLPLRFRKGISPESLRPRINQIAMSINSNKIEEEKNMSSSAVIFRRTQPQINKQIERMKLKMNQLSRNDSVKFSSSKDSLSQHERTLSNTSSTGYPLKFLKERQDFLNIERNIAQQKFFEKLSVQTYKRLSRSNSTHNERVINMNRAPLDKSLKVSMLEKSSVLSLKRQSVPTIGSHHIEPKAYKDDFFERIGPRVTNSESIFIKKGKSKLDSDKSKASESNSLSKTEFNLNVTKAPIRVQEKQESQKEKWSKVKLFNRRSSDVPQIRNSIHERNSWNEI